jgi:site-specific recombinase XerC
MTFAPTTETLAATDIAELLRGYELSLRARNGSRKTIRGYLQTANLFRQYLVGVGMPTDVRLLNREHVEMFIADQVERWRPKTAQVRYGDLRQFFNWLLEEGEISNHPMARMKPPTVPEVPIPAASSTAVTSPSVTSRRSCLESRLLKLQRPWARTTPSG